MISSQDGDIFGIWQGTYDHITEIMDGRIRSIYHKCTTTADKAHICLQILLNDIPVGDFAVMGKQFIALQ